MCVTFVTCEVRVCGLRCRSGSSLYIYRVYFLLTYLLTSADVSVPRPAGFSLITLITYFLWLGVGLRAN